MWRQKNMHIQRIQYELETVKDQIGDFVFLSSLSFNIAFFSFKNEKKKKIKQRTNKGRKVINLAALQICKHDLGHFTLLLPSRKQKWVSFAMI